MRKKKKAKKAKIITPKTQFVFKRGALAWRRYSMMLISPPPLSNTVLQIASFFQYFLGEYLLHTVSKICYKILFGSEKKYFK